MDMNTIKTAGAAFAPTSSAFSQPHLQPLAQPLTGSPSFRSCFGPN